MHVSLRLIHQWRQIRMTLQYDDAEPLTLITETRQRCFVWLGLYEEKSTSDVIGDQWIFDKRNNFDQHALLVLVSVHWNLIVQSTGFVSFATFRTSISLNFWYSDFIQLLIRRFLLLFYGVFYCFLTWSGYVVRINVAYGKRRKAPSRSTNFPWTIKNFVRSGSRQPNGKILYHLKIPVSADSILSQMTSCSAHLRYLNRERSHRCFHFPTRVHHQQVANERHLHHGALNS